MFSIFITALIFLIAFFSQLLLIRIFRRLHIHTFATFIIYVAGLLIVVSQVMTRREFPYTSILVYFLMTVLLVTFSFVPLLGQLSPSSIIMTMLLKKRFTLAEIESAFDEKFMILKRVEDLVKAGLIFKRGQRYIISPFGLLLARLISILGALMGINMRA